MCFAGAAPNDTDFRQTLAQSSSPSNTLWCHVWHRPNLYHTLGLNRKTNQYPESLSNLRCLRICITPNFLIVAPASNVQRSPVTGSTR